MRLKHFFPQSVLPELPVPPIPVDMADDIQFLTPNLIASSRLPAEPWNLNLWLTALESGDLANMMLYGIDGYGVNSHALHYYLVHPNLAVFLQYPWGGIYREPVDTEGLKDAMAQISALDCLVDDFKDSVFEDGEKLVVVDSVFAGTHMGVLNPENNQVEWLSLEGALMDNVEQWLGDQLNPPEQA